MGHFIVKCMNEKCNNYKMELMEGTEICSLCNEPVTKIETNVDRKLALKAIIVAAIGVFLNGGGWMIAMMAGAALGMILMWVLVGVGLLALPLGVFLAIKSKSKGAIALTIIGLIAGGALFAINVLGVGM